MEVVLKPSAVQNHLSLLQGVFVEEPVGYS